MKAIRKSVRRTWLGSKSLNNILQLCLVINLIFFTHQHRRHLHRREAILMWLVYKMFNHFIYTSILVAVSFSSITCLRIVKSFSSASSIEIPCNDSKVFSYISTVGIQ